MTIVWRRMLCPWCGGGCCVLGVEEDAVAALVFLEGPSPLIIVGL